MSDNIEVTRIENDQTCFTCGGRGIIEVYLRENDGSKAKVVWMCLKCVLDLGKKCGDMAS